MTTEFATTQPTTPKGGFSMSALDQYTEKVAAYAQDALEKKADPLMAAAFTATRNELIFLKYEIKEKMMILPEDVKRFCALVDRSEALLDVSGILDVKMVSTWPEHEQKPL